MKLTQEVIDQIQEAMNHTKKDGTENWKDGDELEVCLAGTFAADKFISIINRRTNPRPSIKTKDPDISSQPPEAFGPGSPLSNKAGSGTV